MLLLIINLNVFMHQVYAKLYKPNKFPKLNEQSEVELGKPPASPPPLPAILGKEILISD
jgi:hypothetical protein